MDRLHEIEVFVAVAEAGSLAAAAARLRLSPPAVTRAVSSLEERLGASVFHRTTRRLAITEAGRKFLESARRILSDLDAAEKEAVGEAASPHGHLNVTASVALGRSVVAPVVYGFLRQYPRVTASIVLLDRVVNLLDEGIDVAVRIGHLPDSTLIAKRVGEVRRILVASPGYLAARGLPESPADLRLHSVVAFTGLMPNREWRYQKGQKQAGVDVAPTLEVNDALAAVEAAEAGNGITTALSCHVAASIREGKLTPVLEPFTLPPQPVHLVYPAARLVAPKTRALVDYLAAHLRPVLDGFAREGAAGTERSVGKRPRSTAG